MILDFPSVIEKKTVGVSERGFGTILIFDPTQEIEFKYISNEDVKTLGTDTKAYKLASRLFMQKPAPQEVAIAGIKGNAVDGIKKVLEKNSDWFFLVCTDNKVETVKALSELMQVENKVYAATVNKFEDVEALDGEVPENTFVFYHNDENSFVAEGLAVIMSYNIGGKTAKFKTVQGVKEADITLTQYKKIEKSNVQTYIKKLGVLQTTEGKMLSGEYIDIVLGEYWIRYRLEEAMQRFALTQDKISYDNEGIGKMVGEVTKVLVQAVEQGIIEDGQFRVDYKLREEVPVNDVAQRKYNYLRWVAMLQGAIHSGPISGILTYDQVNDTKEVNR